MNCIHTLFGTDHRRITSDYKNKTIYSQNEMGKQFIEVLGFADPCKLNIMNSLGKTFVNIENSDGPRDVDIDNRLGTSKLMFLESPKLRVLTVTTPTNRFKRQYTVPANSAVELITYGPSEKYRVTITGNNEEEKTSIADLPSAPKTITVREHWRENVYAKTAHDTELVEVNDEKEQVTVFKDDSAKEYTEEEYKNKMGKIGIIYIE